MRFFKKSDIMIVLLLVSLSAAAFITYKAFYTGVYAKAEIYYYSELVKTVDLSRENAGTFSISQNTDVVFEITQNGQIRFLESNCLDKICVKTGLIQTVGQYAACLPNGIIVKIVSSEEGQQGEADIVVSP